MVGQLTTGPAVIITIMNAYNLLTLNGRHAGPQGLAILSSGEIGNYWSAAENSVSTARNVNSPANSNNDNKYNGNAVRPVLALDEEIIEGWIEARNDCLANKMSARECVRWRLTGERDLWELMQEVYSLTYEPSTSITFPVSYPSDREIFAAAFRDRIAQHWICQRLEPLFERIFASHGDVSYNCRVGFGQLRAARDLQEDCYNGDDRNRWVGRFDLQGFFMSLDKQILWRMLRELIEARYDEPDKETLLYLTEITVLHNPATNCRRQGDLKVWGRLPPHKSLFTVEEGKGMPIGNITSQLFANFYMSHFDGVMNRLCARHGCRYRRFVDDFAITGAKEAILKIRPIAERWLRLYLRLRLHPDKVYMQPVSHGVKFVGSQLKKGRTYLSNRTVGRMPRAFAWLAQVETPKEIEQAISTVNSYLGMARHHRSYKVVSRLFEPYRETIAEKCEIDKRLYKVTMKKELKDKIYNTLKTLNYGTTE